MASFASPGAGDNRAARHAGSRDAVECHSCNDRAGIQKWSRPDLPNLEHTAKIECAEAARQYCSRTSAVVNRPSFIANSSPLICSRRLRDAIPVQRAAHSWKVTFAFDLPPNLKTGRWRERGAGLELKSVIPDPRSVLLVGDGA